MDKLTELINFFNGYDIIFICETWLKPNHPYGSDLRDFESIIYAYHEHVRIANLKEALED